MTDALLTGINHVALAAKDLQATVGFYQDVFDLEPSDLTLPGEESNALLFFPNGSFLHFVDASADEPSNRNERAVEGNLLYRGEAIDHVALFAADVRALQKIRERLVAHGASDGEEIETGGVATTLRFQDPDGRKLEVTAYI